MEALCVCILHGMPLESRELLQALASVGLTWGYMQYFADEYPLQVGPGANSSEAGHSSSSLFTRAIEYPTISDIGCGVFFAGYLTPTFEIY